MKKLLCIDDSKNAVSKYFKNWITEGEVYTVRREEGSLHGETRVLLNEIKNDPVFVPELNSSVEVGFRRTRFVEVDDAMNLMEESSAVKEENLILN
jgi:hypothetical protein